MLLGVLGAIQQCWQTLELFAGRPWEIYFREMEQDRTYGDQVTLQAISDICAIRICVLSTLGVSAGVEIQLAAIMCKVTDKLFYDIVLRVKVNII